MSLKSVEMQFAIQKNDVVGSMQNQLSHKPVHDQAMLEGAATKQTEKDREVSSKLAKTAHSNIHEELPHQGSGPALKRKGKKAKQDEPAGKANEGRHPFKGHHIDFSL
ncbi:hypothetical protein [Paenibacillus thalictri]|uniref:RNA polymerase subunit sigma n=1 Tax=Paenibacillus thalictri TaxID=2527873 RepID=A0A4Q9DSB0_9BACL|nr:hypothetical protein [Paenibacillus thalictri]TBL77755.1 hypothetical protein EYB31_16565 [Paenibacillus thalictri]